VVLPPSLGRLRRFVSHRSAAKWLALCRARRERYGALNVPSHLSQLPSRCSVAAHRCAALLGTFATANHRPIIPAHKKHGSGEPMRNWRVVLGASLASLTMGGRPRSSAALQSTSRGLARKLTSASTTGRSGPWNPGSTRWLPRPPLVRAPRRLQLSCGRGGCSDCRSEGRPQGPDGSRDPGPDRADGEVGSRGLWQELSGGKPSALSQVSLAESPECEGFWGLDHILIREALKARQTANLSSKKLKIDQKGGQVIETSDHCPRVTKLAL
jgi:hypothetical protein